MDTIVGKVVVLGDSGVGKTSTVVRYVDNSFFREMDATVGMSFFTRQIELQDTRVKLQIWDTAGQERFQAVTRNYYRGAKAALFMFDITSYTTFQRMKTWVEELKRSIAEPIVLCVIGNKLDLAEDRAVPKEEATRYARSIGASYLECSAMTDEGVKQIFEETAKGLQQLFGENMTGGTQNIPPGQTMSRSLKLSMKASKRQIEPTGAATEETLNIRLSDTTRVGPQESSKCC